MTEPMEALIAHAWTAGGGAGGSPEPEQTWPLCRILAQAGLVEPDRHSVGIAEVGPFRVAIAPDKDALTRAFVEGGLPSVVRALCQGMTFAEAISEVLVQSFMLCSTLAERTVFLRNDLAWCVLVYIRIQNRSGQNPSLRHITDALRATRDVAPDEELIRAVLNDLEHAKPLRGTEEVALVEDSGEGFRALV